MKDKSTEKSVLLFYLKMKREEEENMLVIPIRQAKIAPCSFPQERSRPLKRFAKKSSSLCSGIFPQNLACGNTSLLLP